MQQHSPQRRLTFTSSVPFFITTLPIILWPETNQNEKTRREKVICFLKPLSFQSNHCNEHNVLQGHSAIDGPRTARRIQTMKENMSNTVLEDGSVCRIELLDLAVLSTTFVEQSTCSGLQC